jgi:tetratricopeptide (TPR) repeat protein
MRWASCGCLSGAVGHNALWMEQRTRRDYVSVASVAVSTQVAGTAPPAGLLLLMVGLAAFCVVLLLLRGNSRRARVESLFDDSLAPGALRGYALALLDAERLDDAATMTETHLTRVPADVRMRGLLAALYAAQEDHARAAPEYERALQMAQRTWEQRATYLAPYMACLHAAYAVTLQALGRADEANAARQQALSLDPSLAQARGSFARLLAELARDDELERRAFEDLDQWERGNAIPRPFGLPDASEAIEFFRAAAAAHPTSARLRSDLAQALHAAGDHTGAEREMQEALRLDGQDPWLHFQRALMLWRREHLPEADAAFGQAARLAPQRASIRGMRGVFYLRQQRLGEAEQELVAAVSARPDVWALIRLYGNVAALQGKLQQAARAFQEADRLGANDLAFRLSYADLLEQLGEIPAAAEQYRAAMRLDTNSGRARASYGGFLIRQGRLNEGERELRQALLLPGSAAAHLELARLLLLERRLDEVVSQLDLALQHDPGAGPIKESQAEWFVLRGRATDAEEMTRQLLRTEPPRASLQLVRAGALLALNRQLEAQAALREAVRLDPRFPDRLLAQARALAELGRIGAALEVVGQALALRPDWPEALAERDQLVAYQNAGQASPRRRRSFGPARR